MPYLKDQQNNFIKMHRLLRGYTNAPELAKVLGVTPPTARRKLNEPQLLTLGDLQKISQRLHIPVDELRGGISW